jgi:hypothetical protein
MRRFVLGWNKLGHGKRLSAYIVNYGRWPRDLLSWLNRTSSGRDGGHDAEAEVNGERDEDAGLHAAGREIRLSGLHVWSLLLAEDGPELSGYDAVEETGATHL